MALIAFLSLGSDAAGPATGYVHVKLTRISEHGQCILLRYGLQCTMYEQYSVDNRWHVNIKPYSDAVRVSSYFSRFCAYIP